MDPMGARHLAGGILIFVVDTGKFARRNFAEDAGMRTANVARTNNADSKGHVFELCSKSFRVTNPDSTKHNAPIEGGPFSEAG